MTERSAEGQGTYQRLPVVGSLLRRQRREAKPADQLPDDVDPLGDGD